MCWITFTICLSYILHDCFPHQYFCRLTTIEVAPVTEWMVQQRHKREQQEQRSAQHAGSSAVVASSSHQTGTVQQPNEIHRREERAGRSGGRRPPFRKVPVGAAKYTIQRPDAAVPKNVESEKR